MAASVGAAVQWIGTQLVEEAIYLHAVEEKVEELRDELKWMVCFLQDVDAKRDRDARMREWIKQISWLAYQSKDIIETFILKFELRHRGGLLNKLKRYSCIIREAMARHEFGSDIDALKMKISTLTSRLCTYGVRTTKEGSSSLVKMEQQLRKSYSHYVEDEKIIGLEKDVEDVVKNLKAKKLRTIAIYGVSGLGKTTLAKKVYHHRDIRQYFEAFAWASISQQCHARSVLAELLRGLISNKAGDNETNKVGDNETMEDLMGRVYRVQQEKKCLVVLDDIWENKAWDSLKKAFPFNQENSSGGKLVLTTRIKSVVNYVDNNAYIHEQNLMNDSKAWALLERKFGGDPPNIVVQKHGPEAVKLAKEMLKHCRGLPLAIAALGGILAAKKSLEEWKIVHKNIKSILPNAKDDGFSCKEVLELSYYDLPFHLKPCFLYLGLFPEDTEIPATKVIELWMAEGFLSTNSSDNEEYIDQQGSNSMELGEAYLAELVDRSMVQVGSTRGNGRIKSCRIHDLVRELCVSKAAEENFLKVLAEEDSASSSSSSSSTGMSTPAFIMNARKRYRRFAVHNDDAMKKLTTSVCVPNKRFNASLHVKSLYFWSNFNIYGESSISIKAVIKQFKLLRVLDLVDICIDILPAGVGELVHLRYLSLRDSWVRVVPSSIMKLKSLQTLDLRCFSSVEWSPDMIWRMRQLRHLYMPYDIKKPSLVERIASKLASSKLHQKGGGGLNHNIEVLCNFDGLHRLKDVSELTSLRKLSILREIKEKQDLKYIKNSRSLSYGRLKRVSFALRGEVLIEDKDALRDFPCLYEMKVFIKGRISVGSSSSDGCSLGPNMLPNSLTTLILRDNKIENPDAMQILEKPHNLRKLILCRDSCMGKDMTCSDGGFPKLVFLSLDLENLEEWTIERGAMPSLLRLRMLNCPKLKAFPDGIRSIPNLKELVIEGMDKNICNKVREWKESAVEGDDRDDKGVAREVEDRGLADSNKVINHHIPTIYIRDELGD